MCRIAGGTLAVFRVRDVGNHPQTGGLISMPDAMKPSYLDMTARVLEAAGSLHSLTTHALSAVG